MLPLKLSTVKEIVTIGSDCTWPHTLSGPLADIQVPWQQASEPPFT